MRRAEDAACQDNAGRAGAVTRREALFSALALLALAADTRSQPQAKVFRIGLLGGAPRTSAAAAHIWGGFFDGLREHGFVEGRNIVVEERFYGDDLSRVDALAADLVARRVDVIVAGKQPAPEAARRATATIPIVLINHSDPIGSGLVASFAKPGGNVTGMSLNSLALRGKQLQFLKEVVQPLTKLAVLANPAIDYTRVDLREVGDAARALDVRVIVAQATVPGEFAGAFASAVQQRADALLVFGGSMVFTHRKDIVALAAKQRLPTMYGAREFAEAGGLISYGVDFRDTARRAAGYVAKILNGAAPSDLPIEQPTKYDLVINLRTARALGLAIPPALRARADALIE